VWNQSKTPMNGRGQVKIWAAEEHSCMAKRNLRPCRDCQWPADQALKLTGGKHRNSGERHAALHLSTPCDGPTNGGGRAG
jgi:hypothetical protein